MQLNYIWTLHIIMIYCRSKSYTLKWRHGFDMCFQIIGLVQDDSFLTEAATFMASVVVAEKCWFTVVFVWEKTPFPTSVNSCHVSHITFLLFVGTAQYIGSGLLLWVSPPSFRNGQTVMCLSKEYSSINKDNKGWPSVNSCLPTPNMLTSATCYFACGCVHGVPYASQIPPTFVYVPHLYSGSSSWEISEQVLLDLMYWFLSLYPRIVNLVLNHLSFVYMIENIYSGTQIYRIYTWDCHVVHVLCMWSLMSWKFGTYGVLMRGHTRMWLQLSKENPPPLAYFYIARWNITHPLCTLSKTKLSLNVLLYTHVISYELYWVHSPNKPTCFTLVKGPWFFALLGHDFLLVP